MNAQNYSITVQQREVDGEMTFVASAREWFGLVGFGATYSEAYDEIIEAISMAFELNTEHGHQSPLPFTEYQTASGKLMLRMPRQLHVAMQFAAEAEDVSLNQYVVAALSFHQGCRFGAENGTQSWHAVEVASQPKRANLKVVPSARITDPHESSWLQAA